MLPRIELDRINVHLAGRHVLHDVSWMIKRGQHWAVIGPNGSGKSTLLRVIAGSQWIDADGGRRTYSADGSQIDVVARAATWIRIVSAEQHERYARLALPVSGRALVTSGFEDSVYVHRPPSAAQAARVDTLLDELDLRAFAQRRLSELSAGQFRRLLIARALVSEPTVLVLDECTNGLDRAARHEVLRLLDRLAPWLTLIVASHRPDDVPEAVTDTANIRDGRLVDVVHGRILGAKPLLAVSTPSTFGRQTAAPSHVGRPVLIAIEHADVYRGKELVLKDVNWQIRRGQHTLVRGANGSGKSTFAGLLAGTISAAAGARIVRFGATGPFDIWQLKERIAHISDDLQTAYDVSGTVADVVASGFPASIGLFTQPTVGQWQTVNDILERLGLGPLRARIYTQLSFGERRKVLIARSLVRPPDIYIVDEIWNGLDIAFRHAFDELLAELARSGTTIVAIAHDQDSAFNSLVRRINRIENGELYEQAAGDPENVLNTR